MYDESIIKDMNLSEAQVWAIVNEWYTRGMFAPILMDSDGYEVDEMYSEWLDGDTSRWNNSTIKTEQDMINFLNIKQ
jgi:hypothetical protein